MNKIEDLEKNISNTEDNILLWLDNTEYLYNILQKVNNECINKVYDSNFMIIKNKRKFKSNIWKYRDLLKYVYEEIRHKEFNLDSNYNFYKLGLYLYLRELINIKSNHEIEISTIETIIKVLSE